MLEKITNWFPLPKHLGNIPRNDYPWHLLSFYKSRYLPLSAANAVSVAKKALGDYLSVFSKTRKLLVRVTIKQTENGKQQFIEL